MPPRFLIDLSQLDLDAIVYDQEAIRKCNPQRGDMEHLNGIIHIDAEKGQILGFKDVRAEEFWVPGHIPGRPLFPGVLMIESAAQLASLFSREVLGFKGFIGFGGVEDCKFRMQVLPGHRMHLLLQLESVRHKRVRCAVQGVVNGNLAFEAAIIGTEF